MTQAKTCLGHNTSPEAIYVIDTLQSSDDCASSLSCVSRVVDYENFDPVVELVDSC
jgi:hypothetical protein